MICAESMQVAAVFDASGRTYGSRRVSAALKSQGHKNGRHRTRTLMRAGQMRPKWKRKFVHTTDSRHTLPVAANVLARQFMPLRPNQAWVSDITYIRTRSGWLYLAAVMDLYSRKIVGWAMASAMPAQLVCVALQMAISSRCPPRGLIVHSDRGCQYAGAEHAALLNRHGLVASMSRKGNCWDNAVDGAILPESENGAGVAQRLRQPRRGQARHHRLHRRFLQQRAAAFDAGLLLTKRA
jgi:putative transposase